MVELDMNINNSKTLVLIIIGTLRALRLKVLSINEAEQIVFSPATLETLQVNECDKRIMDMIHLGTELEDVESIIPDQLENSIGEIESMAVHYLKSSQGYDYSQKKTLVRIIGEQK